MKIVYIWRRFSQTTKMLMRCFMGPLNDLLDEKSKYMLEKTFGDKIAANNEIEKVGPKWHLSIVTA